MKNVSPFMRYGGSKYFSSHGNGAFVTIAIIIFALAILIPVDLYQTEFQEEHYLISEMSVTKTPVIFAGSENYHLKCGVSVRCTPIDIPPVWITNDLLNFFTKTYSRDSQTFEVWHPDPLSHVPIGNI